MEERRICVLLFFIKRNFHLFLYLGQALPHKIIHNRMRTRWSMNPISKKMGLQPDILDGATIVKTYGDEYAIIENYKSIIEYTEETIKLQGKHVKILVCGNDLCIVCGKINDISLIRF